MSETKARPSRWFYALALLIPVFACLGAALWVYSKVPELPGALEEYSMENLTQVIVPGSADVDFPTSGAYAVYYEYRSVIDGESYFRDEYPPIMRCQLRSKVSGESVRLEPTQVKGNVYISRYPERAGVMYREISINQPGSYTFSCQNHDGSAFPQSIMAVGPNIVWGFLNLSLGPVAATLSGILAFVAACGISILIIGFVAFKRHQ